MVVGLVGLVLVAFETVQSMRSVAINTLGTTLLFVGVGLFVLAAVMVVVSLTSGPDTSLADLSPFPPPPDSAPTAD
jgi:hypothetical protein